MYEVEGHALRNIQQVREAEWKGAHFVDDEEMNRAAAVLNEQLVERVFNLWRPQYKVLDIEGHAGARAQSVHTSHTAELMLPC